MTSVNFAYWLQGFIELHGSPPSAEQWETIKRHLALVFQHEIDPPAGPPEHQAKLNETHHGQRPPRPIPDPGVTYSPVKYRC